MLASLRQKASRHAGCLLNPDEGGLHYGTARATRLGTRISRGTVPKVRSAAQVSAAQCYENFKYLIEG